MENKEEINDYNYILNMEVLPEFDETTGEFSWNNNATNSSQKNDKEELTKKVEENKDKVDENIIKENIPKYIEELKNILNN